MGQAFSALTMFGGAYPDVSKPVHHLYDGTVLRGKKTARLLGPRRREVHPTQAACSPTFPLGPTDGQSPGVP